MYGGRGRQRRTHGAGDLPNDNGRGPGPGAQNNRNRDNANRRGPGAGAPNPGASGNRGNGGMGRNNRQMGQVRNEAGGGDRAFGQQAERQVRPCGFKEIEELSRKLDSKEMLPGSTDLIRKVTSLNFKKRMDGIWDRSDWTAQLLNVMVKAISHSQSEMTEMTHEFIDSILNSSLIEDVSKKHIQALFGAANIPDSKIQLLNNFILLATKILVRKPDAASKFLASLAILKMVTQNIIDEHEDLDTNLTTLTNQLEDLAKKKNEMVSIQEDEKKNRKRPEDVEGPPPEDFRELSVCPTKEDMTFIGRPYLRKNVIHGRYDGGEHYLDVQFRLLREDFLDPLRKGVHSYRNAAINKRRSEVYVYERVRIGFPELDQKNGRMLCPTAFAPRPKCRWMKQMIFGSLVVLSKDAFVEDFIFGTVADRDIKDLQRGSVKLLFENLNTVDHESEYKMIESSAYYEAYHHVLRGLQTFPPNEDIPFHKYLVEVNTEPGVPSYFVRHGYKIDFGVICGDKKRASYREKKIVDVRRAHEQITPAEMHLDASQHRALTMALKQELVVIQGPPGTGKTHLGHQLSRVLLANEHLWNPDRKHPMLVVCYTNHALDQFLNGILAFMNTDGHNAEQIKMIRVGSRCKDETLKEFMLNETRKNHRLPGGTGDLYARRCQAYRERRDVMDRINTMSKSLKNLNYKIVDLAILGNQIVNRHVVVDGKHMTQFHQYVVTNGNHKFELNDVFIEWLTKPNRPNEEQRLNEAAPVIMDLNLILRLMELGIPEQLAKNLSYLCKNDFNEIVDYYQRYTNENIVELINHPLQGVRNWPRVEPMRDLITTLRVGELDAYNALVATNGNLDRARARLEMDIQYAAMNRPLPGRQADAAAEEDDVDSDIEILANYEREREIDVLGDYDEDLYLTNLMDARNRDVGERAVGLLDSDTWREQENIMDDGYGEWQSLRDDRRVERRERLRTNTERILAAPPCSNEEADAVEDIWALPVMDRWRLYKYWVAILVDDCKKTLSGHEEQYRHITEKLNEISQMTDVELLKSARVLGMTTTGAARLQSVLKTIQCPIVIIEEAAEVLEAHVVTALTVNCKHAILIGDHKQLRPNPTVYDLATKYHLDISLFERLINNEFPYAMLENQHRMREEIADALMPHFYEGLRNDPSVRQYKPIDGMAKNFAFINHNRPEKTDPEQKSHMNEYEAHFALRIAHYLLQQGYKPNQVTILCAYMEQMLFTRKQAEAKLGKEHSVRIEVVDNYQGEESDIIILSLVRSLNPEGRIGFLSVDNRVCVAMSRAKKGFYILGNIDFLASKCTLWSNIKRSLEERDSLSTSLTVVCQSHGKEQVISDWRDFDRLTSQGGCHLPCDYRLDCGHACPRLCHPTKHDNVFCAEPCGRSCPIGHPCKKKCYDKCGKCLINVVAVLPCGHSTKKPCHVDIKDVKCSQPCPEALRCGHRCADKCSAPCTTSCKHPVHKILNCGHPKMMACYEDPGNVRCTKKVRKSWFGCGHQVDVECWIDPLKTPCPHPCRMSLPDCGHSCKGTCGKCRQGRLHVRCDEKCSRVLICGHVCGSKCSSTCPPCEQPCETACFHSRCSSVLKSAYEKQKCRKDLHGKTAGRKCGELCPPCLEKCSNQCVHLCKHVDEDHDQYKCSDTKRRICNKLCMEPCAIEPCDERCSKQLKCGHRCLGLCGEDCPPICKECPLESAPRVAYEEATSIVLSGLEDSLDAMFIMLTCGHCIESTAMDHWVQERIDVSREQDTAIVQLECPMCKTLVKKSRRYQKQLNQRISDIETIKKKLIGGTAKELDGKRQENISNIKLLIKEAVDEKASIERRSWDETAVKVMREMMKVKEAQLTKDMVIKYENLVAFAEALFDSLKKVEGIRDKFAGRINVVKLQYHNLKEAAISFFGSENIISALITEWKNLLNFMNRSLFQNLASSLMFEQFRNEVVRLDRWIILGQVFLQANLVGDIREEAFDAVQKLDDLLNGTRESNSESLGAFQNLLKIFNNGVGVSYEERMEIKRALAGVVQSWYKCKNGHLYGIGDCGQAMERSKCPECGAGIGGEYHRIREDNTLDREMTGEQPYERNPFQAIW